MPNKYYIIHEVVTGNIARVYFVIPYPHESQIVENGFYVDGKLPEAEERQGMHPNLMAKIAEKELYYDYEVIIIPPTRDEITEEINSLKSENETLSEYMLDVDYRLIMIELGL